MCVICHGGSNANAIKNAIRVAKEFHEGGVNDKIENAMTERLNATSTRNVTTEKL